MDAHNFIKKISKWVPEQSDILGVLLVGSYAHNIVKPNSDVDIMLFVSNTACRLQDKEWLKIFGKPVYVKLEDWGAVKTLRTFYEDELEVEFNMATPSWAYTDPIDQNTFRVISDGAQILYDPSGFLAKLIRIVSSR